MSLDTAEKAAAAKPAIVSDEGSTPLADENQPLPTITEDGMYEDGMYIPDEDPDL